MYPYGLIGNCQIAALVSTTGSLDWLCLPRPDSDPVFGRLLDPEGGHFSITLPAPIASSGCRQYYVDNTNVLVTELRSPSGDCVRITDFCPRFEQHGRMYRPMSLFRIVEPVSGSPAIRISCKPINGWEKTPSAGARGNSHLRFDIRSQTLRLTTNMPLTYLCDEQDFILRDKTYFALTWDIGLEDDLGDVSERFLKQTVSYWRTWVKHCSIPSLFQGETIRSALALKLHCYEDTGAILAALTTSLPEIPGDVRNWDYRYCWLRDAYFALSAFHNLGHFEEMEGFLKFLLEIAHRPDATHGRIAPVYTLSQTLPLPETTHSSWRGFNSSTPVRTNNQAAEHVQNDVFGELILALAPMYFDERFLHLRSPEIEDLLAHLGSMCVRSISVPDAGLWEIRNGWQVHTFTNLMSWAGLERLCRIQNYGYLRSLPFDATQARDRALAAVTSAAVSGVIRNGPTDQSLDAALALSAVLRFPQADLCLATVEQIKSQLAVAPGAPENSFFFRYLRKDDFGVPASAFLACSFWMTQALVRLGRQPEARVILEGATKAANHVGLLSEHYLPAKLQQLGNFPQAYSHVGLINSAFAVSPSWSDVL